MRLLIIRHAEPDYSIDSLTEKGWKEAEILSDRLSKLDVAAVYCSPLGRARDTASFTLKKLNMDATILPWMEEFPYRVPRPERGGLGHPWDFPDRTWSSCEGIYDKDHWTDAEIFQGGEDISYGIRRIRTGLDALLEVHGYRRNGLLYTPVTPNKDTILLFCHLGVKFAILSHLTGIAAPVLWQNYYISPSSVTTVSTQHREKDVCSFRVQAVGDLSHLYAAGEPASLSGFFPEVYE